MEHTKRDYLAEARAIVSGRTMLLAERDHLIALAAHHDALVAALQGCDGEAYNGQLDGHDPLASLREIQRIARAALAQAEGGAR